MLITDAILSILEYKFPDNSATAAQIAEIVKERVNWTEEDIEEYLWKLSNNLIEPTEYVEVIDTRPPKIYKLVGCGVGPEEQLDAFLAKSRNNPLIQNCTIFEGDTP